MSLDRAIQLWLPKIGSKKREVCRGIYVQLIWNYSEEQFLHGCSSGSCGGVWKGRPAENRNETFNHCCIILCSHLHGFLPFFYILQEQEELRAKLASEDVESELLQRHLCTGQQSLDAAKELLGEKENEYVLETRTSNTQVFVANVPASASKNPYLFLFNLLQGWITPCQMAGTGAAGKQWNTLDADICVLICMTLGQTENSCQLIMAHSWVVWLWKQKLLGGKRDTST